MILIIINPPKVKEQVLKPALTSFMLVVSLVHHEDAQMDLDFYRLPIVSNFKCLSFGTLLFL